MPAAAPRRKGSAIQLKTTLECSVCVPFQQYTMQAGLCALTTSTPPVQPPEASGQCYVLGCMPALVPCIRAVAPESVCAASVTALLHAGRIWCSSSCYHIRAATEGLLKQTLHQGFTTSALPATLGITCTQGNDNIATSNNQTQSILSAAADLLRLFKHDARDTSLGRLKLVDMFLKNRHPDWFLNNAVTMTLWAVKPGESMVDLQVTCLIQSPAECSALPCHAQPCTNTSWLTTVSFVAVCESM